MKRYAACCLLFMLPGLTAAEDRQAVMERARARVRGFISEKQATFRMRRDAQKITSALNACIAKPETKPCRAVVRIPPAAEKNHPQRPRR